MKEKEKIREAEKEEEQRERERAQAAIQKEQTEWRKKESETRGILMSESGLYLFTFYTIIKFFPLNHIR